jgi:hypothetical protein
MTWNREKYILLTITCIVPVLGCHHMLCYLSKTVFTPGNVIFSLFLLLVVFVGSFYCMIKRFYLTWKLILLSLATVVLMLSFKFCLLIPLLTQYLTFTQNSVLIGFHTLLQITPQV